MTPIAEKARLKLLNAFIGDVRAWKADDAAETLIFAVKNPAIDSDDTSFYALPRNVATPQYLGTTTLGKDGGVQPIVYNDGTIAILLTETPIAGQSGTLADLYLVVLHNKLASEPTAAAGGTDTLLRNTMKAFLVALRDAASKALALIP